MLRASKLGLIKTANLPNQGPWILYVNGSRKFTGSSFSSINAGWFDH
jgi:hypothetical protein